MNKYIVTTSQWWAVIFIDCGLLYFPIFPKIQIWLLLFDLLGILEIKWREVLIFWIRGELPQRGTRNIWKYMIYLEYSIVSITDIIGSLELEVSKLKLVSVSEEKIINKCKPIVLFDGQTRHSCKYYWLFQRQYAKHFTAYCEYLIGGDICDVLELLGTNQTETQLWWRCEEWWN